MKSARRKNPYYTEQLNFSDFYDLKDLARKNVYQTKEQGAMAIL